MKQGITPASVQPKTLEEKMNILEEEFGKVEEALGKKTICVKEPDF